MHASWPSENILLALLCERPMHGYELAQCVKTDAALHAIWRIERSEIYFLLGKLAKSCFIVESAEESVSGPMRVVFHPTSEGRAALDDWLHTPEIHPRNLRTSLLARVYLALRRDPRQAVALIDAQKGFLRDWLAAEQGRAVADPVVNVVHRLRAAQVAATLGALDELRSLAEARL
jgi:DNA-binding PadR family transcriptional regulator